MPEECRIQHVSQLVKHVEGIKRPKTGNPSLRYYRGLSNADCHVLNPFVMRDKEALRKRRRDAARLVRPSGESYRERGARRRTKSNDLRCHGALGSPSSRPWHRLLRAPAVGGEARLPHTTSTAPRYASVADAVPL